MKLHHITIQESFSSQFHLHTITIQSHSNTINHQNHHSNHQIQWHPHKIITKSSPNHYQIIIKSSSNPHQILQKSSSNHHQIPLKIPWNQGGLQLGRGHGASSKSRATQLGFRARATGRGCRDGGAPGGWRGGVWYSQNGWFSGVLMPFNGDLMVIFNAI